MLAVLLESELLLSELLFPQAASKATEANVTASAANFLYFIFLNPPTKLFLSENQLLDF
ncbi:hypothetical protein FC62_GL000783 [Amylolactobacillus amylotrophicus DSM 20534]|uniref:Uncharacterized protein n=2 Tax=Amylolactobacillus TaxID=2767876 RepID=A0A0R1YST4_9LACO|nr:hypothetical protein FC62_GL000783 [Amylolactobacillus amylotrophicus DSM 20534]KRM42275.1 hypothetical protein FD40_GL001061 [Amylolactobacillus amylophilus DSM 20533 = JCM 1125]